VIYHKQKSNSDFRFLVLARPGDILSAVCRELIDQQDESLVFCGSVYTLIAALHTDGTEERPVILITRPSMLDRPHLADVLHRHPNLRLIGWLGPDERLSGKLLEQAITPVCGREQLARAIASICVSAEASQASRSSGNVRSRAKIDPADYQLSHDEVNALLGTG
jgi:hypothetical protein